MSELRTGLARRRRATKASTLVLALAMAGCNSGSADEVAWIDVDTESADSRISLAAYLPNDVRVHPGATVIFKSRFSGEPHTVTLGRLVDRAASANAERTLRGLFDEAPELSDIPAVSPTDLARGTNRLALPCYLESGPAEDISSCSRGPRPHFDGRQSFFSSGVLFPGETFSLKLSARIKPGAYAFFCVVHRAKMMGQVSVVDPAVKAASAERLRFRAHQQRLSARNTLEAAVRQAGQPGPDAALAGISPPQLTNSTKNVFLPMQASIAAGGSVTWNVFGSHVIAFNPPRAAQPYVTGRRPFRLNPRGVAPAGGPASPDRPPIRFSAGTDQPIPTLVDGGRWDGAGFRSSGMLFSFSPALLAYRLTFTTPGNYPYKCLVRPAMQGTVVVT